MMSFPGNSNAQHANLSDLKEVLKETLDARGSLSQIKARIRAEIFAALDDQDAPKPKLSNENLIINELIREYFEYNGYRHALSVFLPESGQPVDKPFHREFLAQELSIEEDSRFTHVPLLYSIIASLQQAKERSTDGDADGGLQHMRAFIASSNTAPVDPASDRTAPPRSSSPRQSTNIGGMKEPSPLMFRK
ncbi:hypothetical protein Gpo141_00003790 [Globisporangium polare]